MAPRTPAADSWELPVGDTQTIWSYSRDVARRNGATPELAEDIAQTTLMRLNEAVSRNRTVLDLLLATTWRSYVAAATRNVLAGYHRSQSRRLRREDTASSEADRLSAEVDDIDAMLAAHFLDELAATLSHEEQLFIHLRYTIGRTINEIAQDLDTTPARVSHFGRAAIRKLKRLYDVED